MKNYKRGEIAKGILSILASGALIFVFAAAPGLAHAAPLFKYFKPRSVRDRRKINQSLRVLRIRKLIKVYKKDGKNIVEITARGRKKMLAYSLREMKLSVPKKWDGWWRIVMFDIPQSKKTARDAVSASIRKLGLFPIQRSVFVSPYLCKKEIDFIGEFFGVREHIIYVKAKEIEGAKKLKEYFCMM